MRQQLRIAIVTKFPACPSDPCGGVESVSVKLVEALSQLGNLEITVVTTDTSCSTTDVSQWGGAEIIRLPQERRRLLSYASREGRKQVLGVLQRLRPDVVHAHDVYGLMVRGLNLPRVFTVHGFIHEDTRISGGRWARARAWMWKRAETSAWADQPHIISISPYVREYIRHFTPAVIHDIDNPVGEAFFELKRNEVPGRIFSAVGNICQRKNVHGLISGFAVLRRKGVAAELHISGGAGDQSYFRQIMKLIKEQGLDSCVRLLGRLGHDQIHDELSSAAVFALVSREENSPISIEEAMAAAVPVIASNRCGMPYMVRHGESGYLVDPDDPDNIARGLNQVLSSRELRLAMGSCGRNIALDRFHPLKVARRTSAVYSNVASSFNGQ